MKDSGYDVSDFRAIHYQYGNAKDFDDLIKKAKELGIKVILEFIPNHTSTEHLWFLKSNIQDKRYADYYIWRNRTVDGKPPNNWLNIYGKSAWECPQYRKDCYLHQFHSNEPELNYNNPHVQVEILDIMRFWLDKGVDGFRINAAAYLFEDENYLDEPLFYFPGVANDGYNSLEHIYTKNQNKSYQLVQNWTNFLRDYADSRNTDEKVLMTEVYADFDNTLNYYKSGVQIPSNFFLITHTNSSSSPREFQNFVLSWMSIYHLKVFQQREVIPNWVTGNSDQKRTATRHPGRSDQMTMLAMILPGVAVTYYGEEIGMVDKSDLSFEDTRDLAGRNAGPNNYKRYSRDPSRTPMQWDNTTNAGFNNGSKPWFPIHQNYVNISLAAQKAANASHYKIYAKLINLKKTRAAIISGTLLIDTLADDKSLVVIRSEKNESIVLVINFSNETVTLNVREHVPSIGQKVTVEVATLESSIKEGSSVNLDKLTLGRNQALVMSTILHEQLTTNNPPNSTSNNGSLLVSSAVCVLVFLAAFLS
ncbi:maltase 2 isoform X2 [Fopius arisanus]|nr:PREDICTED: maltase 2-like isoform X2 [Fopius arisanus]